MSSLPGDADRDRGLLAAIIESSDDAILSQDLSHVLVTWNRGAERIFGYSAEEALGRSADFLIPPGLREKDREIVARIERGERVEHYRTVRIHKDGRRVEISLTASPVRGAGGRIIGVSAIARDIGEQRRLEDLLARQSEELCRSNEDLDRFAAVASHDLQEPLRTVTSYVQLLERRYRGRLDTDADQFMAYIVDGATRMRQLIQDLLSYSRVNTSGSPFERVGLGEVVENVRRSLTVLLEETGGTLTHGPLPAVWADAPQMEQLLQNLIGNALKFRRAAAPEIRIEARREPGAWRVSVADNGLGIDRQYFDRIFVIFQRLHGREEYGGTGMGLAICKKIVERHGGKIWVESQPGQGSVFFFTLPEP